jgi:hypothetical protein
MTPKSFGVDLNLYIGMHASWEMKFAIRRRSKVQLCLINQQRHYVTQACKKEKEKEENRFIN